MLKKRISNLEEKIKSRAGKGLIVISAFCEDEFQKKRAEYLKTHPVPEIFVFIREFTQSDFLKGVDREWKEFPQN